MDKTTETQDATYVLIWQWFCSIFIIKIESVYDMNRN